jgi:hypothetical protein
MPISRPFLVCPSRRGGLKTASTILEVEAAYSNLLGARIDKIGPTTTERALAAVAPFISGNDRRIRNVSPQYLRIPALLHRLGIADSDTGATLALQLRTGEVKELALPLESSPNLVQGDPRNWSMLFPADPSKPGRWVHVLDTTKTLPQIYRKPVDVEAQWLTEDHRILYIRSNEIAGTDGNDLSRKLLGIIATEVIPNQPKSVIADLRLNSGGNFGNATLFSQALPKVLGLATSYLCW